MAIDQKQEKIDEYFKNSHILIVDPSQTSRVSIARMLGELGTQASSVALATTVTEGKNLIKADQTNIIICEYNIGQNYGIDFIQQIREQEKELKDCLTILVTGNTSQSAVARAAEEDVDCFILKPYTIDRFKKILINAAMEKIFPSDYVKKIEEGKNYLSRNQLVEAEQAFKEATSLNKEPALAYFYLGQTELIRKSFDKSKSFYESGIALNKIHYKCLVGLYDVLYTQKKFQDAYEVVRHLARYFPANPKRLSEVLRLAIVTQNYQDIEAYYETFTNIEDRNVELINYICSALIVCGKHFLKEGDVVRALELFKKASVSSTGQVKFLKFIIEILIKNRIVNEAAAFLKRFPAELHGTTDYLVLRLMVMNEEEPVGITLTEGKRLLGQDISEPIIYKILIQRSIEAGFIDAAENYVFAAKKLWPDQQQEFDALLSQ